MFNTVAMSWYIGTFSTLVATGFGFPMPEEIPIVAAGMKVGHDAQDPTIGEAATRWYIMLPIAICGVVLGDTVLYAVGRLFGSRILQWKWVTKRILPREKREKIEENFRKRGIMILLGARFTPGIRSPIFFMSGVLRLPLSRFVMADALYAIPGVNGLFWLAYIFTDQFMEVVNNFEHKVEQYRPLIIVAVLSAIIGVVIYRYLNSRTISTGDPEQIPTYAKPVGAMASAVEHAVEKAVEKTMDATMGVIDKVTHHRPPSEEEKAKPAEEEMRSEAVAEGKGEAEAKQVTEGS